MRSMLSLRTSTSACGSSMTLASDLQEPFVAGADTWIDRVVADIPNAEEGFTLIFSSAPFPGHQYRLDWRRAEGGGNWYYSADLDMEGWLCPALFRYFSDAPASLYAQVKPGAYP